MQVVRTVCYIRGEGASIMALHVTLRAGKVFIYYSNKIHTVLFCQRVENYVMFEIYVNCSLLF
jgi:hypothetical protein